MAMPRAATNRATDYPERKPEVPPSSMSRSRESQLVLHYQSVPCVDSVNAAASTACSRSFVRQRVGDDATVAHDEDSMASPSTSSKSEEMTTRPFRRGHLR